MTTMIWRLSHRADPFRIEGPACVSFSGGRTSAYMLRRILDAWGGTLPEDVIVCFANTGKEMPQTLDFVNECSKRWGVEIVWLEYRSKNCDGEKQSAHVTYETASREGEPYEALIRDRRYLPNPVSRFCTTELKIRPMHWYLRALGWEAWDQCIGLRHDEQRRVAKIRARGRSTESAKETMVMPLVEAGVTKHDVAAFWRASAFDLQLPNNDGTTPLGNCDLCFLKGATRITSILRERPELGEWWARMEEEVSAGFGVSGLGGRFRSDRPTYRMMIDQVKNQRTIFDNDEPIGDCFCVD